MTTSTVEAIELPVIEERDSTETCTCTHSGASTRNGTTLDGGSTLCTGQTCALDSEQSSEISQVSTCDNTTQRDAVSESESAAGGSTSRVLQFLTKTWLGNILATAALLIALAGLGITAYSSVLQALAAKWSMRNDAFQSCLSVSTLNMSSNYCKELLTDGFEAPPGILRARRNPSELRSGETTSEVIASDSAQFLTDASRRTAMFRFFAVAIVPTMTLMLVVILAARLYSRTHSGRIFTSLARSPAFGWTNTHVERIFGYIVRSTLVYTSKDTDMTQQHDCGECLVILTESDIGDVEDDECTDQEESPQVLTKIGVSYYSDDDCDDLDDTGSVEEFEPPANSNANYKRELYSHEDRCVQAGPIDMSFWFTADAKALRDVIMEATTTCKNFDLHGNEMPHELGDTFCADTDLHEVVLQQKSFIKRLYVEAKKAQTLICGVHAESESSRTIQEANEKAHVFHLGVTCRSKAFATLVSICVSPTSEMWRRFEEDCLLGTLPGKFADELLPFDVKTARLRLGSDYECFYSRQWHFCPVGLMKNSKTEFRHPDNCLRLPLLERHLSFQNSIWSVTRVKFKGGVPGVAREDETLVMVQLPPSPSLQKEMKWALKMSCRDDYFTRPSMALQTESFIYLFFWSQTWSFYDYVSQVNNAGPSTFADVKAHFNAMLNFLTVSRHRENIMGIYTRLGFLDGSLRPENILVSVAFGKVQFQLAFIGRVGSRGDSSNDPEDTRAFLKALLYFFAWLVEGAAGLKEAENPRDPKVFDSWTRDGGTIYNLNPKLLKFLDEKADETTSLEERTFYNGLRRFCKNYLYAPKTEHENDLVKICMDLKEIVAESDLESPTNRSAPQSEAIFGRIPSHWRRRLPWRRRRASLVPSAKTFEEWSAGPVAPT